MPRGNGQGLPQQPVRRPMGFTVPMQQPMQQPQQQQRRRAPQKQMAPGQQMHQQQPVMPEQMVNWVNYLSSQCETTPEQNQGLARCALELNQLRAQGKPPMMFFNQRVPVVFDKIPSPEPSFVFVTTGPKRLTVKLPAKAAQYIGSFKFMTPEEALLDVLIDGKLVMPMEFGERGMNYYRFEANGDIVIQFVLRPGSPCLSKGCICWFIINMVSPKSPEGVLADLCKETHAYEAPKEAKPVVQALTQHCRNHPPFNALEIFKILQVQGTAMCPMCKASICLKELKMKLDAKRPDENDAQRKERDAATKKMYETMCLTVRLMTQEPNWGNVVFGEGPAASTGVSERFEYESTDDYLRQIEQFYT